MSKRLVGALFGTAVLIAGVLLLEHDDAPHESARDHEWQFSRGISPGPVSPPPASIPDPAPSPGIFDDPPYPSTVYTFINGWESRFGQKDVGVYAGSITSTHVGTVMLLIQGVRSNNIRFKELPLGDVGPVRIVSASPSGKLTLRANTGERLVFDVQSRRFQ